MGSGAELLLEVLESEGVSHVFGNPGTTELPLIDALSDRQAPRYVLGLHESVALGMADGYARSTGRPSFVNLHTAAGLGNAMGTLSNVAATRTPMVLSAGQQDRRHLLSEPFLSGNLTAMATGLVKWAAEVHRVEDLGLLLRRAFNDAASPPCGPVFLSIPMDVLQESVELPAPGPSDLERRALPEGLGRLASEVLSAPRDRFAVVASDEVASSGASEVLVQVAERLGCLVYGAPMHSSLVFPTSHELWAGALPADSEQLSGLLAELETVLLVGSRGFMTFAYREPWPVPSRLKLLHLSPAAEDLGRTYRTEAGFLGDPRATLQALLPLLVGIDASEVGELRQRAAANRRARLAALSARADAAAEEPGAMHPLVAVRAVLEALPAGTVVVDEAVSNDPYLRELHSSSRPGGFLYSRGGGLGWGLPAAMGVSLAEGRRPVVAVVGDGSFLYCPQALWTAVREEIPVLAVVLNNRGYLILRRFLPDLRSGTHGGRPPVGLDIVDPPVDVVEVARGFGARAARVEEPAEVGERVREALSSGRPTLLELPVAAPGAP